MWNPHYTACLACAFKRLSQDGGYQNGEAASVVGSCQALISRLHPHNLQPPPRETDWVPSLDPEEGRTPFYT